MNSESILNDKCKSNSQLLRRTNVFVDSFIKLHMAQKDGLTFNCIECLYLIVNTWINILKGHICKIKTVKQKVLDGNEI